LTEPEIITVKLVICDRNGVFEFTAQEAEGEIYISNGDGAFVVTKRARESNDGEARTCDHTVRQI
jgi:hypothetical protein